VLRTPKQTDDAETSARIAPGVCSTAHWWVASNFAMPFAAKHERDKNRLCETAAIYTSSSTCHRVVRTPEAFDFDLDGTRRGQECSEKRTGCGCRLQMTSRLQNV